MAREQIPVTPRIIAWARERAGYSIEEARQTFKNIEAWEAGRAFPTYTQLEHLANTFKLPVAVFFFPEPPTLPPINETFRTLPEAELTEIPRRIRLLLRKAKALQLNLYELFDGRNPAPRMATVDLAIDEPIDATTLADRAREYIGVTIETQMDWTSDDEALKQWRQKLLDIGIFVFKDAFKVQEYSGFCLHDDEFPIIYVNNSAATTRQIFTLFHEFAHLLFHTSGVDTIKDTFISRLQGKNQKIEILCNRFAAQFLLPDSVFEAATKGKPVSECTASILALRFHVSREVIFRKYLDRGLISEGTYLEAAARWAGEAKDRRDAGGNPYWTKIVYLGRPYIDRALRLYHQNRIDQSQLADYLDWKPKYLESLEEYFMRGAD